MIALVKVGKGWSIARGDSFREFEWWCGTKFGWEAPGSDMWELQRDCWNEVFPTCAAAERFARAKGWL